MSNKFKAIVLNQTGDQFSREVKDLEKSEIETSQSEETSKSEEQAEDSKGKDNILRGSAGILRGVKETGQILTFYFIMFILFRIFDIVKPYPVSYYDKNFKNSFGVIMDDICAGLYVVAVLVLYMVITS